MNRRKRRLFCLARLIRTNEERFRMESLARPTRLLYDTLEIWTRTSREKSEEIDYSSSGTLTKRPMRPIQNNLQKYFFYNYLFNIFYLFTKTSKNFKCAAFEPVPAK